VSRSIRVQDRDPPESGGRTVRKWRFCDLGIPPPKVRCRWGAAVTDAIGRDMPRYAGYPGHEIRSPILRTSGSPVPRSRDDGPQGSSDAGSVQHHLEHDSQECGDRKSRQEGEIVESGTTPRRLHDFLPVPPAGIEPAHAVQETAVLLQGAASCAFGSPETARGHRVPRERPNLQRPLVGCWVPGSRATVGLR
jgi:hypothetical protein